MQSNCDCEEVLLTRGSFSSEFGSDWAAIFCGTDYILDRILDEPQINIAGDHIITLIILIALIIALSIIIHNLVLLILLVLYKHCHIMYIFMHR